MEIKPFEGEVLELHKHVSYLLRDKKISEYDLVDFLTSELIKILIILKLDQEDFREFLISMHKSYPKFQDSFKKKFGR